RLEPRHQHLRLQRPPLQRSHPRRMRRVNPSPAQHPGISVDTPGQPAYSGGAISPLPCTHLPSPLRPSNPAVGEAVMAIILKSLALTAAVALLPAVSAGQHGGATFLFNDTATT